MLICWVGVAAFPRNIKGVISPKKICKEVVICPTIIVCHFPENNSCQSFAQNSTRAKQQAKIKRPPTRTQGLVAEGGRNGATGRIRIFPTGGKYFLLKEGKRDKTRKITKKIPKHGFFPEIMWKCADFYTYRGEIFLGYRGGGFVNKLPRSKVNSFLLFVIFFPGIKKFGEITLTHLK